MRAPRREVGQRLPARCRTWRLARGMSAGAAPQICPRRRGHGRPSRQSFQHPRKSGGHAEKAGTIFILIFAK